VKRLAGIAQKVTTHEHAIFYPQMKIPPKKLHKASGLDRARYKGQDYYFGTSGSLESEQRYDQWVKQLLAGNPDPSPKLGSATMAGLVKQFLDHAKKKYSVGEYCNVKSACGVLLATHRPTRPNHFGPKALADVRDAMIAKGWPRTRVNEQISRVRRVFRWGVSQEIVSVHTVLALRELLPLREGEVRGLTESSPVTAASQEQVDAVLAQLVPTLATMVRVHQLVGMRPSELFTMRPDDIDRTDKVWVYWPRQFKTKWRGKKLPYAIGPKVQKLLKPYLDRPGDEYLFTPRQSILERQAMRTKHAKNKPSTQQLSRRTGRVRKVAPLYNRTSYRNALARAVRRITGSDEEAFLKLFFRPNQLRHKRATEMRSKVGIEDARASMGHSDISATLIYAEADLKKAKEIARKHG